MIDKDENIIIVGSQNSNTNDRFLERSNIKSVQYFDKNKSFEEISFFSKQGELGISSICWKPSEPLIWFYTTGTEIIRLNLETKESRELPIDHLKDIHEISIIDGFLWISNTCYDELVCVDLESELVKERFQLGGGNIQIENGKKNKYHSNQVFSTYDGELTALVHHVNGEQLFNRVAQKLIKSQGNGGVLFLKSGKTIRLQLKAPHSVRKVNGQYWIFDSGHAQLNVYSKEWKLIKEMSMAGWGRGGDFSDSKQLYYAGVSAKRKRYLAFNEENKQQNMLQIFNYNFELKAEYLVPNIEQINNVYLISANQLELIRKLG
ncbi:MAG: hypothetical protein KDB74_13490 [Flavobacteriales bacterium]|nr:hypothetical protein [Flavobacteriales bacterium]